VVLGSARARSVPAMHLLMPASRAWWLSWRVEGAIPGHDLGDNAIITVMATNAAWTGQSALSQHLAGAPPGARTARRRDQHTTDHRPRAILRGKGSWAPLMNDKDALSPAERRVLAQMPRHAITSVHGEAGLQERLILDIAAFPATGRERVEQALRLASR
jgi:hypothetical protein